MFKDKRVIVTGGSSGLGLALGLEFVRRGARVGLVARDPLKLGEAASLIAATAMGARVEVASADVSDSTAIAWAIALLSERMGGIDVLVNSAGVLRERRFDEMSEATFREVMEINYFGPLWAARAALPHLKRSRGRIVNIASMAGLTGVFGYAAYSSSKFALVGLSEVQRVELSGDGVRVHLVCPPEFDSPMIEALNCDRSVENLAHTLTIPKTTIEVIVRETMNGILKNRFLTIPGRMTRLAAFGIRHFPKSTRAVGDLRVRQAPRALPVGETRPDPSGRSE